MRSDRIGHRTRDAGKRRDVKNDVDSFDRFGTGPRVPDICDSEVDAISNLIEVVPESGDEIIDDSDLVAEPEQSSNDVRANETGAAGNQRASWSHEE